MSEPITIEPCGPRGIWWTVSSGGRYETDLDSGEALWCVVNLLMGRSSGLRTKEQHDTAEASFGSMSQSLESWQKQLPPCVEEGSL